MIHALKSNMERFEPVWDELKQFEVRLNDRDYAIGDILLMCEYDSILDSFSRRFVMSEVVSIYDGKDQSFPSGLEDGYIVLGTRYLTKGTCTDFSKPEELIPMAEDILAELNEL